MKTLRPLALAILLTVGSGGIVLAQTADANRGRALAESWCATCHIVAPDYPGGDVGPSFERISDIVDSEADALRVWLAQPHDPMPNFDLSTTDIEDILAHIRSLKP